MPKLHSCLKLFKFLYLCTNSTRPTSKGEGAFLGGECKDPFQVSTPPNAAPLQKDMCIPGAWWASVKLLLWNSRFHLGDGRTRDGSCHPWELIRHPLNCNKRPYLALCYHMGYSLTIPYSAKPIFCHPLSQCLNETLLIEDQVMTHLRGPMFKYIPVENAP